MICTRCSFGFLPPPCHECFVAAHAEDSLRCARITQILDLFLAIAASEATRAEGLLAGQDGEVLDLVAARGTGICTVVADQGAVAEEE